MKPKEYIKLLEGKFNKGILITNLNLDLQAQIEFHKIEEIGNIEQFHNITNQLLQKYKSISFQFPKEMPRGEEIPLRKLKSEFGFKHIFVFKRYDNEDTPWKELFNNCIFPLYNQLCRVELNELYSIHKGKTKEEHKWNKEWRQQEQRRTEEVLKYLMKLHALNTVPTRAFRLLCIEPTKCLNTIKTAFRQVAKVTTPDTKLML